MPSHGARGTLGFSNFMRLKECSGKRCRVYEPFLFYFISHPLHDLIICHSHLPKVVSRPASVRQGQYLQVLSAGSALIFGKNKKKAAIFCDRRAIQVIAETELSVLSRQCLGQRIESIERLQSECHAWNVKRNELQKGVDWQFTNADARIKLKRLCNKNNLGRLLIPKLSDFSTSFTRRIA